MKRWQRLIGLCAVLFLAACAGTQFSWDQARSIKVGMDKEEVTKIMGSPNQTVSKATGEETWVWVWVTSGLASMNTRSFTISFKEGRVATIPSVPDAYK